MLMEYLSLSCLFHFVYINLEMFIGAIPLGFTLEFFFLLTLLVTQRIYFEIIIPRELSDQYISRLACLGSKISK